MIAFTLLGNLWGKTSILVIVCDCNNFLFVIVINHCVIVKNAITTDIIVETNKKGCGSFQ
jgi:hypothetical protein